MSNGAYSDNTFWQNLKIFRVLLQRDIKILIPKLHGRLIDTTAQVTSQLLLFGLLLPALGMPRHFIGPILIGSQLLTFFSLNYGLALTLVYEMKFGGFINYQLTLPLPKRWLFDKYLTYFTLEAAIISIPAISTSIFILRNAIDLSNAQWVLFFTLYIFGLFMWATFFLSSAFIYDNDWFRNNMWARRNTLLFTTSTHFTTWYTVHSFSPKVSMLFLLSPATHHLEALRAALLGRAQYLPLYLTVPMMVLFIGFNLWLLNRGIYKKLDPV